MNFTKSVQILNVGVDKKVEQVRIVWAWIRTKHCEGVVELEVVEHILWGDFCWENPVEAKLSCCVLILELNLPEIWLDLYGIFLLLCWKYFQEHFWNVEWQIWIVIRLLAAHSSSTRFLTDLSATTWLSFTAAILFLKPLSLRSGFTCYIICVSLNFCIIICYLRYSFSSFKP